MKELTNESMVLSFIFSNQHSIVHHDFSLKLVLRYYSTAGLKRRHKLYSTDTKSKPVLSCRQYLQNQAHKNNDFDHCDWLGWMLLRLHQKSSLQSILWISHNLQITPPSDMLCLLNLVRLHISEIKYYGDG